MKKATIEHIVRVLDTHLLAVYMYPITNNSIPVFIVDTIDFIQRSGVDTLLKSKECIILTRDDLVDGSDIFPMKFLHMQRRATLLHGEDLLHTIKIKKKDLRLNIEAFLRNTMIQLREQTVASMIDKHVYIQLSYALSKVWDAIFHLYEHSVKENEETTITTVATVLHCKLDVFVYLLHVRMGQEKFHADGVSLAQRVHDALAAVCIKINDF